MSKKKQYDCDTCCDSGKVAVGVTGKFNARTMDFDIVDEMEDCPDCDFKEYASMMEEDYWEARAEYERETHNE